METSLEDKILKVESVVNYIPRQCGRYIQREIKAMTDSEDAGTVGKVLGVVTGYFVVGVATALISYDNYIVSQLFVVASPELGVYRWYVENKRNEGKLTEAE